MDLTEEELREQLEAIAAPIGAAPLGGPLENPDVKPITEELLILPHPGEPGVLANGLAHPVENPPLDEYCDDD